jgi:hypothetical protein
VGNFQSSRGKNGCSVGRTLLRFLILSKPCTGIKIESIDAGECSVLNSQAYAAFCTVLRGTLQERAHGRSLGRPMWRQLYALSVLETNPML